MEDIYLLINKCHNEKLVIPSEQPNGNTIYHLYNNMKLTYQKGGWAYLLRSEFTSLNSLDIILDYNRFPKIYNNEGYIIVTEQDAIMIRNIVIKKLKN